MDAVQIESLHETLLRFFDPSNDPNLTKHPAWSFEAGVVATLDWLLGIPSEYANEVSEIENRGEV